MIAAKVLQSYVDTMKPPRLCVFPDANYYWLLARTIRQGGPYEIVEWGTNFDKGDADAGLSALSGCLPSGHG